MLVRDPLTRPEFGADLDLQYPGFAQGPPVLWLPMTDPANSRQMYDLSPYHNKFTLVSAGSGLKQVGTAYGPGWQFDGSTGFAYISNPPPILKPQKFTAGCLVKASSGAYLLSEQPTGSAGDGRGWELNHGSVADLAIGTGSGTFHNCLGGTTLVVGKYYWIIGTFDGSTVAIYLNGRLDGTLSVAGPIQYADSTGPDDGPQPQTLYLGAQHNDTSGQTDTANMTLATDTLLTAFILPYPWTAEQVAEFVRAPGEVFAHSKLMLYAARSSSIVQRRAPGVSRVGSRTMSPAGYV
jgi:hypothetical protein